MNSFHIPSTEVKAAACRVDQAWVNVMCQIRLRVPAWVSCYVNTIRDTLTACMDVRAAITLMHMDWTDSSSRGDEEEDEEAVSCLQRGRRGQSRNYCGILMQVQGGLCPPTSCLLTNSFIFTRLSPPPPTQRLLLSSPLRWSDIKPKPVDYYSSYRKRHVPEYKRHEGEQGLFLSSTGGYINHTHPA